MNVPRSGGFAISDIQAADKPAYLEHLAEKEIYAHTLAIPYPYREADADRWLELVAEETAQHGRPVSWAIRDPGGRLAGGIGLAGLDVRNPHRAELGYWLAKPYWGGGIMTEAVRKVCEHAFDELGVVRITAHVFAFNARSARVLEKAGFQLEERLRKHYLKDGKVFDGMLYARVRD